MRGIWVAHDVRDHIIDFIRHWSKKTEIADSQLIQWIKLPKSKYYDWIKRYGHANEHNAKVPRDHWLEDWEKEAIKKFYLENPLEGYRRCTFMMLDQNIVAVSPSSVYRVLRNADLLRKWNPKSTAKGRGFTQPDRPHLHWHVDVSYINISGTFYYLCSVLDGYSRFIVHFEIRESMTEKDVEIILQRAKERFPMSNPQIITDNGPQFIAKDFKEFIRVAGMSHVKTSPSYPQSNGKIERWHKTVKSECIRPKTPLSLEDAIRIVTDYVYHYNNIRLHSAIGYIAPKDKLWGREKAIFTNRDRKLETAREIRRKKRQYSRGEGSIAS